MGNCIMKTDGTISLKNTAAIDQCGNNGNVPYRIRIAKDCLSRIGVRDFFVAVYTLQGDCITPHEIAQCL